MRKLTLGTAVALLIAAQPQVQGSDIYVYPAQGQSQNQQAADEGQCQAFARSQTGFDPMSTPTATGPAPQEQGSFLGGAARGALLGTAVGAIAGDTGEGAAIGAAAGGLLGGMRRNSTRRQADEYQQQQAANYNAQREGYMRAYGACLEGRGYTVR